MELDNNERIIMGFIDDKKRVFMSVLILLEVDFTNLKQFFCQSGSNFREWSLIVLLGWMETSPRPFFKISIINFQFDSNLKCQFIAFCVEHYHKRPISRHV